MRSLKVIVLTFCVGTYTHIIRKARTPYLDLKVCTYKFKLYFRTIGMRELV